jgi:pimeloyl-ACP methyl ester carboxylesterase
MSESNLYTLTTSTILNAVSYGTRKASTPTLIFLHFWGGSSRTFTATISHLSPNFHAIAIDFRGWGQSTGPHLAEAYSIVDLATDIESLIPKLDIQDFILVGHSMGGKVAQLIAGRNLVNGLRGVVLIGPAPPTPFSLPPDMKAQQLVAYSSPESAEFVVKNVLSSLKLTDETTTMLVEDMLRGNEFATAAWPNYAMGEDVLAATRSIKVPVLVIAGELDRVEPVERVRAEVVGIIEHAELVVVRGSGHLLPVEAPEKVAGYIESFVKTIGV